MARTDGNPLSTQPPQPPQPSRLGFWPTTQEKPMAEGNLENTAVIAQLNKIIELELAGVIR